MSELRLCYAPAAILGVAMAAVLFACGGAKPAASDPAAQPTAAGRERPHEPVTLRFVNQTGRDIFVDVTRGFSAVVTGPEGVLGVRRPCTPTCADECTCLECPEPAKAVRRIADGEAFDASFDGTFFEHRSCGSERCACDAPQQAPSGSYDVFLRGGRALDAASPRPVDEDPSVVAASLSDASCTASARFTLGAGTASTYEVAFKCTR